MKLFALCTAMLLSTASLALAQDYSNYAHDCEETGFNGDYSSTFGLNCGLSITRPQPHMSFLSLNNCVSWDSSNLVGHKGGGYSSLCTSCTATSVYSYSCSCEGVTATIDLTTLIGVNSTTGNICCNAGTDEDPWVTCG